MLGGGSYFAVPEFSMLALMILVFPIAAVLIFTRFRSIKEMVK